MQADVAVQRKRLFFALWPDDVVRQQIAARCAAVVAQAGGRATRAQNLHLTMAFLGAVDVALLPCLGQAARRLACEPVELVLRDIGLWRRSGILWLAPEEPGCAAAGHLAAGLWKALGDCGLSPEQRPFRPHVTLARRVTRTPQQATISPLRWTAGELALVASTVGGPQPRYAVLDTFTLAG